MKEKAAQKGFTLIEMLMTVALASIVGAVLYVAITASQTQVDIADVKMTVQDNIREGLHKVLQDVRQSAPDKISLGNCDGATPPTCTSITFTVPGSNNPNLADGYINWSRGESITYALTGTQLIRTNNSTGAQLVYANDMTAFSVIPDQWGCPNHCPNSVTFSLSAQKVVAKTGVLIPANPNTLAATVDFRNTIIVATPTPSPSSTASTTGSTTPPTTGSTTPPTTISATTAWPTASTPPTTISATTAWPTASTPPTTISATTVWWTASTPPTTVSVYSTIAPTTP